MAVVPALARAMDILELFLAGSDPRTIPEITASVGLPRSTVHDIVKTLADRGYLQAVDGKPQRYWPGLKLLELGERYVAGVDLTRLGQQIAAETRRACDETVHVAILDGTDVIYIAKEDSSQAVRMVSSVGGRFPAHCTAGGKLLLSGLSDDELAARLDVGRPLPTMTPESISSFSALMTQLNEIRHGGLAYDYCESTPHAACVAAPVHDRRGDLVAAISMSVPIVRWSTQKLPERERLITEASNRLSSLLGYRVPENG